MLVSTFASAWTWEDGDLVLWPPASQRVPPREPQRPPAVADTALVSPDLRSQSLDLAIPVSADILRQPNTWAI
jgi:hypothetical protein